MKVDLVASQRHYYDHLAPVWQAIPLGERGDVFLGRDFRAVAPAAKDIQAPRTGRPVLVASYDDLCRVDPGLGILFEHGVGQSYGGSRESAFAPAYVGGSGRDRAAAFLHPNEQAAARDRARYPSIPSEVVGYPRLPGLQQLPPPPPGNRPAVAVSCHWHAPLCPETRSGFGYWWPAVKALHAAGNVEVLGHAHPRLLPDVRGIYERAGIEVVSRFESVLTRADCFAFDNTSSGFEFAAVRGPVVVLDNPGYRRGVEHGLRFWSCADIGPRISELADLPAAVDRAVSGPWPGADRLLESVFPAIEDPAGTAAARVRTVVNALRSATTSV